MSEKRLVFILFLVLGLLIGADACGSWLYAGDYRTITDMCGNKVEVPVSPRRIACMHCVSPEKIMTLGKGNLISVMAKQSPWAYKLYPEIKNAQTNPGISPKQMLDMKIDFVLYTPGMTKGEQFSSAGLKTVCAFSAEKRPMSVYEFKENVKAQITLFGDLLGPDAKVRADKYNSYFDKKIAQILSITSKIDRKNKPAVYYGGLRSSLMNGQGKDSFMHWITEISGGNYLPQALDDNHAKATTEQVLSWEPDMIFLSGYVDSIDIMKKDPRWASIKAVKNGKVYRIPRGIYPWDHASGEGVLLMIYMAKIFHPDQFKDWDMTREMKTFYSEVYGKTITDRDAERILQNLPPL